MRAFFGTLAGLALLTAVTPAQAQQRSGGTSGGGFTGSSSGGGFTGSSSGGGTGSGGGFTGSSSGGGFTGSSSGGGFTGSSSGGGFTGSSSGGGFSGSSSGGGFTGSSSGGGFTGSSSGGGFTGTTGGGITGTTGGGATGRTGGATGSTQVGSTSFLGTNYRNPLSMGIRSGSATGTTGTGTFGQPLYPNQGTATIGRTGTAGGMNAGGLNTGLNAGGLNAGGMTGQQGNAGFRGVTTAGIRRAPQYTTEPVFARATPPVAISTPGALQEVLSSSSRFPAGSRIQVTGGEGGVVLRGSVGTDREKRIAELMIRMTPGVREVKNELTLDKAP